jgi:hypothetical protein
VERPKGRMEQVNEGRVYRRDPEVMELTSAKILNKI